MAAFFILGDYMDYPYSFIFFSTLVVIIFFGITVSAITFWIKSAQKTKELLKDPQKHWSVKMFVYYGIYSSIFIIAAVFLSLIALIALTMSKV